MSDLAASLCSLGGFFFGVSHLEDARRGNVLRPFALLRAGLAGYLVIRLHGDFQATEMGRAAFAALMFCSVSPFLGYFWWGRNRRIRFATFRFVMAIVLSAVVAVAARGLDPGLGVVAGVLTLMAAMLPWKWIRRSVQKAQGRRKRKLRELDEARHREALAEQESAQHFRQAALVEHLIETLKK